MDLTINTNRQSVNRHSDFALRMSLLKDGEPYTPTSFVMAFYVDEWDCETVYTASLIGGEFINCSISGDVISVYFDHPHFPLGTLKCRVVDKVRDINFKDGTFDTVTPITLPVEIVTGGGTDSVDVGDVAIEGSVGYMPPEGGIPKSDLAADVRASLGKADTAVQLGDLAIVAMSGSYRHLHDTPNLAPVATSGSYNDLQDKPNIPAGVTVDSTITQNGTNPVQGGAIYSALEGKVKCISYDDENELLSDTSQPNGTIGYEYENGVFYIYDSDGVVWNQICLYSDLIDRIVDLVPATRKVNGKALSSNITLNASDVGAQSVINDLATIRSGASAGATAYQKPASGIPASDIASGVIPDVSGFVTEEDVEEMIGGIGKVKSVTINGTNHLPNESTGIVDLGTIVGQKGDKGDKGDTGETGATGPQGPQGNSGVASADAIESVNNLNGGTTDTTSRVYVLGANQGKRLRDQIDYVYQRLQSLYSALGNIAFWDGKPAASTLLPDLDWGNPKHTVTLALSLTNAVVKHNGVAKSNGDSIQVEEGGTLTLTIEPESSSYAFASAPSVSVGGNSVTPTNNGNGTYSVAIVMGGSDVTLNVAATAARSPYQEPANGELVLWLDGADDNTALSTKWVDRIGGVEFPISGAITRSGSHYQFAGTWDGNNALMGSTEDLILDYADHTVEVVFKPTQNDKFSVVCTFAKQTSAALNGLYFSLCKAGAGDSGPYVNGMYLNGTSNVWKAAEYTANKIYCFGLNKTAGLQNGTALSSLGKTHWNYMQGGRWIGSSEKDNIPGLGGKVTFVGDIYAVRIYRGQLTAAQMLHNQKIDNERYGLGLTLPDSVS